MSAESFQMNQSPFRTGVAAYSGPQQVALVGGIKRAFVASDSALTLNGPVGVGKTASILTALERSAPNCVIARIGRVPLAREDVLEMLLNELGVSQVPNSTLKQFTTFQNKLREWSEIDTRVFVVIEDVQRVGIEGLEELESLTAMESGASPGAHLILMGTVDMRQFLDQEPLARLKQRVVRHMTLAPYSIEETRGYIEHRLAQTDSELGISFEPEAVNVIHHCSTGIPRLINTVAETMILSAGETGDMRVTKALAVRIAADEFGYQHDDTITPSPDTEGTAEHVELSPAQVDSLPTELESANDDGAALEDDEEMLFQDTQPPMPALDVDEHAAELDATEAEIEPTETSLPVLTWASEPNDGTPGRAEAATDAGASEANDPRNTAELPVFSNKAELSSQEDSDAATDDSPDSEAIAEADLPSVPVLESVIADLPADPPMIEPETQAEDDTPAALEQTTDTADNDLSSIPVLDPVGAETMEEDLSPEPEAQVEEELPAVVSLDETAEEQPPAMPDLEPLIADEPETAASNDNELPDLGNLPEFEDLPEIEDLPVALGPADEESQVQQEPKAPEPLTESGDSADTQVRQALDNALRPDTQLLRSLDDEDVPQEDEAPVPIGLADADDQPASTPAASAAAPVTASESPLEAASRQAEAAAPAEGEPQTEPEVADAAEVPEITLDGTLEDKKKAAEEKLAEEARRREQASAEASEEGEDAEAELPATVSGSGSVEDTQNAGAEGDDTLARKTKEQQELVESLSARFSDATSLEDVADDDLAAETLFGEEFSELAANVKAMAAAQNLDVEDGPEAVETASETDDEDAPEPTVGELSLVAEEPQAPAASAESAPPAEAANEETPAVEAPAPAPAATASKVKAPPTGPDQNLDSSPSQRLRMVRALSGKTGTPPVPANGSIGEEIVLGNSTRLKVEKPADAGAPDQTQEPISNDGGAEFDYIEDDDEPKKKKGFLSRFRRS